jgi:transposase
MRGDERIQDGMFGYVTLEQRVPQEHPLREIRGITDAVLRSLSGEFDSLYSASGRPSIAPEYVLRALLLQAFYSVRSERQLVEQLDYNLLFRWFVGLGMDDAVWNHAVFSKNRDRLLTSDVAQQFFAAVIGQAKRFMSDDHFTVDGTLIQSWASQKIRVCPSASAAYVGHQRLGFSASYNPVSGQYAEPRTLRFCGYRCRPPSFSQPHAPTLRRCSAMPHGVQGGHGRDHAQSEAGVRCQGQSQSQEGRQGRSQGTIGRLVHFSRKGGEPAAPRFLRCRKSRRENPLWFLPAPSSRNLPAPARRLRAKSSRNDGRLEVNVELSAFLSSWCLQEVHCEVVCGSSWSAFL